MTDIPLVIRVAANLDTLRANLAEGTGIIETTTSAMQRMSTAYDGSRAISQAGAVVAAIQQIGGVTKLTADEQAKANAILQAAVDKYAALGKEAPPQMIALANATKQASDGLGDFLHGLNFDDVITHPLETAKEGAIAFATSLGPVGLALIAAVTAGTAFGDLLLSYAQHAAAVGGALNDMSEKTGIAVAPLSNLSGAAQIAGSSLEQVSGAIFIMQKNMAEGGPKIEAGFQRVGLSIADIRKLSPDQQFLAIADAIKGISDPADKAAAAMEIFGKQGRELLPLLSKDLQGLTDESARLGLTWTETDAKAAEEFEMKSRALDLGLKNLKDTIGRELIPALTIPLNMAVGSIGWFITSPLSPIAQVNTDLKLMNLYLNQAADTLPKVKAPAGFSELNDTVDAGAKALMAEARAAQFMEVTLSGAYEALTPLQEMYLAQLKDAGLLDAEHAKGIGVTADQLRGYITELATADAANKKYYDDVIAFEAVWAKFHLETLKLQGENDKKWHDEAMKLLAEKNKAVLDGFLQIQSAQQRLIDFENQATMTSTDFQVQKIWDRAYQEIASFKGTAEQKASFVSATLTLASEEADALYSKEAEFADRTAAKFDQVGTAAKKSANDVVNAFTVAFAALSPEQGGTRGAPGSFQYEAWQRLQGMFFQNNPPPMRGDGGPVSSGMPYMVGERGPELFVPSSSGSIVPNGAMAGGSLAVTTNVIVDGRVLASVVNTHNMSTLRGQGMRIVSGA